MCPDTLLNPYHPKVDNTYYSMPVAHNTYITSHNTPHTHTYTYQLGWRDAMGIRFKGLGLKLRVGGLRLGYLGGIRLGYLGGIRLWGGGFRLGYLGGIRLGGLRKKDSRLSGHLPHGSMFRRCAHFCGADHTPAASV